MDDYVPSSQPEPDVEEINALAHAIREGKYMPTEHSWKRGAKAEAPLFLGEEGTASFEHTPPIAPSLVTEHVTTTVS